MLIVMPAGREKSAVEMEYCKGHTFYEIPPTFADIDFREGVVMKYGSTLAQVY